MKNSNVEQIVTLYLMLAKGQQRGTMIAVPEYVDEKLYHQIVPNLTTKVHKGKSEIGMTKADGVNIRIATSNFTLINQAAQDLLLLGEGVILHGMQGGLMVEQPRNDLKWSLEHLDYLWHKDIPFPKSLSKVPESAIYRYEEADLQAHPQSGASLRVNQARMIPAGYLGRYK